MTPSVREVMAGTAAALSVPPSPDAGPDYFASRMGLIGALAGLAAREADHAAAAALAENADIRAVFQGAAPRYVELDLAPVAAETDTDLTLTALDAANARLRRLLITLHEAVEAASDASTNRTILDLYVRMAAGRRLRLAG
ncbi:MAG TPA: hypothetical protein VGI95_07845 [Caulobacteraceae bacterium]|jgi:hypothetical protein